METATSLSSDFMAEYRSAMQSYILSAGEPGLNRAYELGRKALDEGRTLLDISRFHADVLANILVGGRAGDYRQAIAESSAFFSEFLSPFEMTFRGFLEAVANLRNEIAERQNAEEALKHSERYYKSLIENALDIVTILDADARVKYTSPSGERVLGYSAAELEGRNVFELVHPDDMGQVLDIFAASKQVPHSTATAEFRIRHRSGDWLIMESIGKNLLDDPFVNGIIVNSRDITDRRNLEEIRRKYEFIVNTSREYMLLVNADAEIEAVNEACCVALSRSRQEMIGRRLREVVADEALQRALEDQLERCFEGGEPSFEDWFDLPASGNRYLEIDCYPYRNVFAAVTHAIVIIRDATIRKVNEDRIRESQRQRSEDLRRYAQLTQQAQEDERRRISRELHDDICQRLTALKLHLNVLEDSLAEKEKKSARKLASVKNEIDGLINEVRRISHNLRPSALDHFGLPTALKLLSAEVKNLSGLKIRFETNITSRQRYDAEVETALYRIAQEALANAAKHTRATQASLTLRESGGVLSMTVADTGPGFDFQEYLTRAASDKHFGLTNMRERIELCGGRFTIESSPRAGTLVEITVPATSPHNHG